MEKNNSSEKEEKYKRIIASLEYETTWTALMIREAEGKRLPLGSIYNPVSPDMKAATFITE